MKCAETSLWRSGRTSERRTSSSRRSGITGPTKSPGIPAPSPRQRPRSWYPRSRKLLCWTALPCQGPAGKQKSPGSSPEQSHVHRSSVRKHKRHSRHRSRRSRSRDRMPTASVSATPARSSGSGLPADEILQPTLARMSAAKSALTGPLSRPVLDLAVVAPLLKGLTPEEERAVMLMRAARLADPLSVTRMLTPLHHGFSPLRPPCRSARLQATDDEEVLSMHSGLEVRAQDNRVLDRDIEMRVEEPVVPPVTHPPLPPCVSTASVCHIVNGRRG